MSTVVIEEEQDELEIEVLEEEPVVSPVVSLLRRARDWLPEGEERWCQDRLFSPGYGQACAIGALYMEAFGIKRLEASNYETNSAVLRQAQLELSYGLGPVPLAVWNDQANRQYKDVLELYDTTIQRLLKS